MEFRGVLIGAVVGYLLGKRRVAPADCPECPVCVKPTPCPEYPAALPPAPAKTPPQPTTPAFVQVAAPPVRIIPVAPTPLVKTSSSTSSSTPQVSRSDAGKVIAMVRDLNELRAVAVAPIAARGAVPRELDPHARWGTTAGGPLPVSGTLTPQVQAAAKVGGELASRAGFPTVADAVKAARTSAAARQRIERAWLELVNPFRIGANR